MKSSRVSRIIIASVWPTVAALCFLQACSAPLKPSSPQQPLSSDSQALERVIQGLAKDLAMVSPKEFSPGKKLLITSLVDLNDFKKTSAFGRLFSERLMTSLSNLGFEVLEIRRGSKLYVLEQQGEMILTRDSREIPATVQAGAVLYGTYLASEQEVLVTARIARASDFGILRSWDGQIKRSPYIDELLEDRLLSVEVYERIPQKEEKLR